ncbi:MAG: glutamate mutase L [Chloroflexi bacterium]|nr:glutamate mutase L [Chloroflexota bacterium]
MLGQTSNSGKSILAMDFGSVNTRVMIIDVVDGQYRMVTRSQTRTTMRPPIGDVTVGMSRAIENIQDATGRILIDHEGVLIFPENEDGGIDRVVATSSASRPLRAVLVGLIAEVSLASARHALNGTYIEVAEILSISDGRTEEERINAILKAKPDLIFISGGTDGGNQNAVLELTHATGLALMLLPDDERPNVLYAGNEVLADTVVGLLQDHASVFVASNVRPDVNEEKLGTARVELANVYSNFMTSQPVGGFDQVISLSSELSGIGIVPTAQGVANMVRFLGELLQKGSAGVLHVDIGSTTSTLVSSFDKQVNSTIRSDLGLGHSLLTTLAVLNIENVLRWLPFAANEDDLWNYAYNKVLMPTTIPQTMRDLMIEQAIAREIIRYLVNGAQAGWRHAAEDGKLPAFRPIIVAGATLTDAPHHGVTAMLILDAFELEGIHNLYIDPYAMVALLGAIAYADPTVTVQTFEHNGLVNLGTAFCATGRVRGRSQRPAMKIQITLENGRAIEKKLLPGEIWAAPLSSGQEVQVVVRTGRGIKINGKRRVKQTVTAGTAGLIFDARGRSLVLPPLRRRPAIYAEWWTGVTGQVWTGMQEFSEADPLSEIDKGARETRRDRFTEEKLLQEVMSAAELAEGFDEGEVIGSGRSSGRDRKRGKPEKSRRGRGRKDEVPEEDEAPDILERLR